MENHDKIMIKSMMEVDRASQAACGLHEQPLGISAEGQRIFGPLILERFSMIFDKLGASWRLFYDILCFFYLTFNRFWPQEVLPERRKEGFGEKLILEAERWVKEVLRVQEAEFISKRKERSLWKSLWKRRETK